MPAHNILILLSDEHARSALGCSGHPLVQTPNLDCLAEGGTRFTQAYTPSPICVSARASLATGRYVHRLGCWSSAEPYDGSVPGWGRRLIAAGHRVASIGKLHYRDSSDLNGFDEEILPMHVAGGVGWLKGLLRRELPDFEAAGELAKDAGQGDSSYLSYDRQVAAKACDWLAARGQEPQQKPWVLFVSFVCPHYPLIAPPAFYDLYPTDRMPAPDRRPEDANPVHPVLAGLRRFWNYDDYFDAEKTRIARAAYYGLCSFLDNNVGQVLGALDASGAGENTQVLYSSDHGEMLGEHGFWCKSVMYEDSAGIPMILSGPGVPQGRVVETPVSLVDVHQTVLEGAGLASCTEDATLPGHSLRRIAEGEAPARVVLSEYHDGGAIAGIFMIRQGRWKYIHYAGHAPQLFDMESDPAERNDLGEDPAYAEVRADCEAALRKILDPDAVNAQAFADQARKIAAFGGEAACLIAASFNHTPVPAG